jgi:formylglycine-generating enzyme required for sulfatase activity
MGHAGEPVEHVMRKMMIAVWAATAAFQCALAWSAGTASAPVDTASAKCDICPEMLSIPGGEFMMGSPAGDSEGGDSERPQRLVQVKPFALGKTEVTLAQWQEFATASGYKTEAERNVNAKGCRTWAPDDEWAWREGSSWRGPGWLQKEKEPVVCISWVDAQAYVHWLDEKSGVKGWRLPSEAEWEYAARAGSTTRRYWADDEVSCVYANGTDRTIGPRGRTWGDQALCKDGYWFAAPVGHYKPNAWGLHDMLGNVWEWVQDCYLPYAGAPSDGSAHETDNCPGHVLRGGAWDEPPGVLRSAERFWQAPGNRTSNIGLRVARTLSP